MTAAFNQPVVCPILVGRTHDLAALHLLMDQAKIGQGQIALLCGEAGVGKSRLVAEIKTESLAQGFQFLQGQCFPTDHSCPYAPLLDLLRSIFLHTSADQFAINLASFARELAPLLPEVTQLFPELATLPPLPSLEPEQEKRRLFAALARFFLTQAATHPLLLIVEDVHWSDETSLDFLHYLAHHCAAQPLLVLLTYRSDEVGPGLRHWLAELEREHLIREVPLSRLTRSETDTMLRAIFHLKYSWHPATLDTIYGLTEGNPFFIEEILKSLVAAGEIVYADGLWERKELRTWHIPRSIQDAVKLRADRVSESAKHILILAAVAGRRFDFAVLQQVTHHDEQQLLTLMKELIAAQLVVEESADHFSFRHALTRQAIYAQLLVRERKTLHRTIAETIERLYQAELSADLAFHFSEAGVWEKALEYAPRAGEKAQRLYAPRTAVEQFTRAVEAAHHLAFAPSPTLYRARGQAYETLGEFDQARHDYEQALEVAHSARDGGAEWQGLIDLGFLWAGRDYQHTGAYFRQALELAREIADPRLQAHSLNRLGNWHVNVEQPLEALRCHQEALATFRGLSDVHGLVETLDLLGLAYYMRGDLVQSAAYYQQAVELFREMDHRQGLLSSLVVLLACSGNYRTRTSVPVLTSVADVVSQGEMALSLARQIGQRSGEAQVLYCLAQSLGSRGEYARALELAQESLAIAEEIEHRQWMTTANWTLGMLYLDLLELETAHGHLEQALRLAQELGSVFQIRYVSASLALLFLLSHDLAQAESVLTAALDADAPAHTLAQQLVWCARAELALGQSDPNRALQIIDQLKVSAPNVSGESDLPRLAHLRGVALMMLQQTTEAETVLQAAQAGAITQGMRPLLWRIAIDLGKLYQIQQRDEEAESALVGARTLIEELAAGVPDVHLRENFLHQATATLPRTHPLSPGRAAKRAFGGLTEREREVAILIKQGKSNREIAEVLTVSERTVETHVRNILTKLDLTSRTQIAVWAVTRGTAIGHGG